MSHKYVKLSPRVKRWREEKDLSIKDLAAALGVRYPSAWAWENEGVISYEHACAYVDLAQGFLTLEDFGYGRLPDGRPVRILDLS